MTQFILNIKEPDQEKQIKTRINSAFDKILKFYEPDMRPKQVYLNLIYSKNEFNKKIGRQTPDWMAGFADQNTINLLSPSIIEKYSSHSQNYFDKLLTHELTHIFTAQINDQVLMWLDEGLALHIAGQDKKTEIPKDDWDHFINNEGILGKISYNDFSKHSGYRIAYLLVKILLDNFNKGDIIKLLKIKPKQNNTNEEIEKILKVSIGQIIDLNKKSLQLI